MKVVDIANEIYMDEGSPTSTSVPAIAFWIRGKVGEINNLLFENYVINASYEIVNESGAEITPEAVSIIKKLFKVYYYDVQIRGFMNAITTDSVLEVTDNGSSVRKVNRNEVSKTLSVLKKDEVLQLQQLITAYRLKGSTPSQVTGDDTISGETQVIDTLRS